MRMRASLSPCSVALICKADGNAGEAALFINTQNQPCAGARCGLVSVEETSVAEILAGDSVF